ncbi:hypothetical protein CAPTEDRAFT_220467 [Capitella teleta]|uniref:Peptidase S8/S53 domain-containing protein n=1 Tax=Capitella teleta TaxID=283909 RepID=R7TCK1_CAPTE|nr:hypothetical protein CAPTEDRAFT_220467 [Capitella teleta]|eukprot:ELT91444.1 hypothetical protein CAPTEDRAFT_220467 [Capitella teleta]
MDASREACVLFVVLTACCASISKAPLYGSRNDINAIKDEYLVVFKEKPSVNCSEAVKTMSAMWALQNKEMQVLHTFHINGLEAVHLKTDHETLDSLREMPDVLLVEVDQQVKIADDYNSTLTTADPVEQCVRQSTGSAQWSLSRINSRAKPYFGTAGYDYSAIDDGSNVDVYIVDTGVYIQHQDFESRAWYGMTADALLHEGNDDHNGHGTHVAGIAAGLRYGVAKKANIISVKVLDYEGMGSVSGVIQGIQWAVDREASKDSASRGRAVLNLSLGTSGVVHSLDTAIQAAISAGVNVVIAAGNDAADACSVSPGRVAAAISVGATTLADSVASFSNFGPCVNILAPGQDIISAYKGSTQMTQTLSGTSQAAPLVAGVVARHLSSLTPGTSLSPARVLALISDTASTGRISLTSAQGATPNLLLYKECTGLPVVGSAPDMDDIEVIEDIEDIEATGAAWGMVPVTLSP